jgi:uncharacterized protein (DUF2236 family)
MQHFVSAMQEKQPERPSNDAIWAWIQSLQIDPKDYPSPEALFDAIWQEVLRLRQQEQPPKKD